MKKFNDLVNRYFWGFSVIFSILFVFSLLALLNALVYNLGQETNDINNAFMLTAHIKDNNLILPMPHIENFTINNVNSRTWFYEQNFNKSLNDFTILLQENYLYNNYYNCKYWSYVWSLYWVKNKDRLNLGLDYITTDNHIFVMMYNKSGYIIADGNEVIIVMEDLKE